MDIELQNCCKNALQMFKKIDNRRMWYDEAKDYVFKQNVLTTGQKDMVMQYLTSKVWDYMFK